MKFLLLRIFGFPRAYLPRLRCWLLHSWSEWTFADCRMTRGECRKCGEHWSRPQKGFLP